MAGLLNTCGPSNNVSQPPFLDSEPSPPVTACVIYYNGNNNATTLLEHCCGTGVPIATFNDGCLQYCNLSTSQEAAWGRCINVTESGVVGYCITMGKCVDGTEIGPFGNCIPTGKNAGVTRRAGGVLRLGIAVLLTTGLVAGFV
jgi:hypothetical protein